jgi:hypothetical protein
MKGIPCEDLNDVLVDLLVEHFQAERKTPALAEA